MNKKSIKVIIITAFFSALFTSIFSKIFSDSWFIWIVKIYKWAKDILIIEQPIYISIIVILFFIIAILLIRYRNRNKRNYYLPASYPMYGYKEIGYGKYLDVKWSCKLPNQGLSSRLSFDVPGPEEISGDLEVYGPICPECDTQLREKTRFLLCYKWICDKCSFTITKHINKYEARERAQRVIQSDFKKHLIKQKNDSRT